ncbi:MAG: CopG family transcriptional regulator [Clostridiales bacterium]|nr:CopG family transcriptional regulator [Clostridiales bacterium]
MSPKTGRPTDDPKKFSTRIRMTDEDIRLLEICAKKTGMTKSDIIRQGIREVYAKIENENCSTVVS